MNVISKLTTDEFIELIKLERYVPKKRCSLYLLHQLQDSLANNEPYLNPSYVLAAIEDIEGGKPCGTANPTLFHGQHLKGLWHKHYKIPSYESAYTNMKNELRDEFFSNLPKVDSEKSALEESEKFASYYIKKGYTNKIVDKRLTGEWLIFAKYKGKNYYLCLANHPKNRQEDEKIRNIIENECIKCFPFLGDILV